VTISFVSTPLANHVPPLGILLTFAWIVATSIVLVRRPRLSIARTANSTV
jgi:hypothetical protein